MNVFNSYLEAREGEPEFPALGQAAEARLLKFDAWVTAQLRTRLDWTWAGDETAQGRRIHQARNYLERLVLALWRRGWLLDGKALAKHIVAPLDAMRRYQQAGQVKDFWPYFCATVDRYVGVNSEEIQVEARRVGVTMGQILAQALVAPKVQSLPELVAHRAGEMTLREKQQKLRAQSRAPDQPGDPEQMRLL